MDVRDRLSVRSEYQILNDAIRDAIRRSASSVVSLGYMLRRMMDEKLWEGHYGSLDEYLRSELHMDYTMACRFEAINRKYSIGGRSVHIDDKWEDYSQGVLIEMLNMPPELEAKVTPDMTVRQVREMKRQAKREKQGKKEAAPAPSKAPEVRRCRIDPGLTCGIDAVIEEHFTKGGNVEGCAGCCAGCRKKGECGYACEVAKPQMAEGQDGPQDAGSPEQHGGEAEAFPAKDEVPDAEFRELEPAEEVATSQPLELVKPDKRQSQYLDDFAKRFIRFKKEWLLADFNSRVMDVTKSPEEIKGGLSEHARTWYFSSGKDKAAHIELLDGHVSLWDGEGGHMGDFDWFYVAAAIQSMWNVVALETVAAPPMDTAQAIDVSSGDTVPQEDAAEGVPESEHDGPEAEANPDSGIVDRLAEVKRILEKEQETLDSYLEVAAKEDFPERLMFKQQTIVAALADMVRSMEEAETAEPEAEEQPPLPLLKNNDQRKEWLKSYKDWGLWYRDDNIGVDYYKYDFENGVRLVVEVYQEEATKYHGPYESSFLHLIGGREAPMDQHGVCKWQMHKRYARYPNSETELVEFLKELQRKGDRQG